jgi:hypothetical protein
MTLLGEEEEIPALKNVKLSKDETDFLKDYRRLEDLEREKGIKFFECIGDPPITKGYIQSVTETRKNLIDNK